ncbi:MAG: LytR/AlgR family response regulator transcription factor [Spirosomataceae bacterium]
MTACIIDDEPLARAIIRKFLEDYPEITLVGEAENGFEALKLWQEFRPDLLFLDIQMPKITGFEFLELLENPPMVLFTTAYDQYALQAFEQNALDYLLKPFSKARFKQAMDKVLLRAAQNTTPSVPIPDMQLSEKNTDRIVIKNGNQIEVISYNAIFYLESDGDYVWIHTEKGRHLKQKTMRYYENLLSATFVRIHRSFLVNEKVVEKLHLLGKNSYQVQLKNGVQLAVSKSGYQQLKDKLDW